MTQRGKLIIFEGIDRSGKTTQSRRLYTHLIVAKIPVVLFNFPNFNVWPLNAFTPSGIQDLCPEEKHAVYEYERACHEPNIKRLLEAGIWVLIDRWFYSGNAYSGARGLTPSARQSSVVPDIIFYFKLNPLIAEQRKDYGKHPDENIEFQKRVYSEYEKMEKDESWVTLDADQPELHLWKELKAFIRS